VFDSSRRKFLLDATRTVAAPLLLQAAPLRLSARESAQTPAGAAISARQLDRGWQFRLGAIHDLKAVWSPGEDQLWKATELPHCFNAKDACDPDASYFRGQGWYRTRIAVDNPFADGRTVLHFRGAGQTTTLWVGSNAVGTHKGGYDEFSFDITDAVRQLAPAEIKDGVPIAVCCDNSTDLDRVPSDLSDFCLYGGLYRHVSLAYLPAVALDSIHMLPTLAANGTCHVSVKASLYNPAGGNFPCTVSVHVLDPEGTSIHQSTQTIATWNSYKQIEEFEISSPQLWAPESPHLYGCRVTLSSAAGQTSLDERFGIRQLEFVEHGPFKLNGKRVLLRGTQRHADHAGVAAAMTDAQVREEMKLIREMGANFVRLAHYQQDRLVLDLCDELGLMVWEEVPWCRSGIGSDAFKQNAKQMLTHMIDQHYNHPSVILWGLGNEDDWPGEYPSIDERAIRSFMTEMRDLAHSLDGSRLTSFRRCDFARDIPDVYSPSIWAGWYRGNYREYEESLLTERDRVKRFLHIEWGADSHAGRHSEDPEAALRKVSTNNGTDERGLDYKKTGGDARVSKDGDWSETYACNLFDWCLKTQEKLDWLAGSAQWVFKDFASPLRGDNGIPGVNQKGVVERDLTKKESYYVFQSYWAEKPMAHIYGHSWPIRGGAPGQKRTVRVYSNCDHAELFLNGKSLGTLQRDSQNFPAAGLRWDVEFAPGPNKLRVVATRGKVKVADEIDQFYQTESWGAPAELKLVEKSRRNGIVTVHATLLDARGIQCLDGAHLVRFSLADAGSLIDNLGTTRGSRAVQLANGRAEISLLYGGPCRINAASDGLPTATLTLS
jgi:beta-galactosidase